MLKSKILVLVSGSIAAYKACYLVSKLVQSGFEVQVVASKAALEFVGAASFEALSHHPVHHDLYEHGKALAHISLMRWADLIIVAPATANTINRFAGGIADDLLTTLFMAHDFTRPFLVAPAMNTQMYLHPTTQASLKRLKEMGVEVLETASGVLACQEVGQGKLLDPDAIVDEIARALGQIRPTEAAKSVPYTSAPKILITSGGCVEQIDQVRAITNLSSGATGARLCEIFADLGAQVHLVRAKNAVVPFGDFDQTLYGDFASLKAILEEKLAHTSYDLVIHAAAVSDYSVASVDTPKGVASGEKISSDFDEMTIRLKKNPKLLSQIKSLSLNPHVKLIGFKLTGTSEEESVKQAVVRQITEAECDLVVQNAIEDLSGEKAHHKYQLFSKDGNKVRALQGIDSLGAALSSWFYEGLGI